MNTQLTSLPPWQPLVLWCLTIILAFYALGFVFGGFSVPLWFEGRWFSLYAVIVHGIFGLFCLWWWQTRHRFYYVLIPMAAFLCTPISLFIMSMAHNFCMPGNGAPGVTYPMVIPESILVFFCFWWRLTENEVLYVWLPMALIACSPFGLFFLSFFF